jgi:CHRD domain
MTLVRRLALPVFLVLLFAPLAGAQTATFQASLDGKQQSPPIDTTASGTATFTLSADGMSLSYTVSVVDTADITMAHIHIAAAGQNGPVAAWLYPSQPHAQTKPGKFTGVLATGTITAADLAGPLQGKTIADLVADIKSGSAYVNVHTTAHPGGEIRGQIQ